jgi:hypothetical protein
MIFPENSRELECTLFILNIISSQAAICYPHQGTHTKGIYILSLDSDLELRQICE